jgi:hypothetical protein
MTMSGKPKVDQCASPFSSRHAHGPRLPLDFFTSVSSKRKVEECPIRLVSVSEHTEFATRLTFCAGRVNSLKLETEVASRLGVGE